MARKGAKSFYDEDHFIAFAKELEDREKIKGFLTELKCPTPYKRLHFWPEDLLSISLNSDQLASAHTELLETLIKHPHKIQALLDPNDNKLEKWTKKKNRDTGTLIEKAKEKTQAFRYSEQADSDPILIIRFDNVIDQNRKIRKKINTLLSEKEIYKQREKMQTYLEVEVPNGGDLATVKEDEGELPEAYKLGNAAEKTPERTYYPAQIFLANQIVDRIKAIYSYYHKDKPFSLFENFDFCIYTANINMLEDQTWLRLSQKESECFPDSFYEGSDSKAREEAKKRVFKYNTSTIDKKHQELLKDVKTKKNTLFLIVADEAHWGVTTEEQANNTLVNTWDSEKHSNVILLQVTATPHNLLTENTRLPMAYYKPEGNGNYIVEEKENIRGQGIPEDFKQLHRVRWTESSEAQIQKGIVVRLKIPLADPVQLYIKCPNSNNDHMAWHGKMMTEAYAHYSEFLIQGPKNQVTISTHDGNWILIVKDQEVAFVYKERREIGISTFVIKDCYGEGLMAIKCQGTHSSEQLLVYNEESNRIEVGRRTLHFSDEYEVPKLTNSFLIEQSRPINSIGLVKEYLSLNYYFNSMRNKEVHNQLIRQDLNIETMVKEVTKSKGTMKLEIDDILTAEYCYYIIITNLYRTLSAEHTSIRHCFENFDEYIRVYSNKRDEYINKFLEELEKATEEIYPIESTIFKNVLTYFSEKVLQEFEDMLESFQTEPTQITDNKIIYSLLSCLLHLKTDSWREINATILNDIINSLLNKIHHFDDCKPESVMKEIVHASETGCIVDNLLPKDHKMQGGTMNILRTNKQETGNRMYKTLCIARKISNTLDYSFEILRDYSTANLTDDFDDKLESDQRERTARYRIRERLQPKKCTFIDSETNTTCPCAFGANEKLELLKPSMECKHCNHVHKRIEKYEDLEGLPCILILIQKGRLGDTFPKSLRVLDSRVCHTKQMGPINLTSVVQEMGRLCRYQKKGDDLPLPYALIGKHIAGTLRKALRMGAPFHAVIEIPGVQLDRRTLYKKRNTKDLLMEESARFTKTIHIPRKGHYDENNAGKKTHKNRILLGAEPQIGKTGVYLKVISILQQHFSQELEDETDDEAEDSAEEEKDEVGEKDDKSHWVYPYWKHNEDTPNLVKIVSEGRYPHLYGSYCHGGSAPEIIPRSIFNQTTVKKKRVVKRVDGNNRIKSFNFREHGSCVECFVQYESDVFELCLPHSTTDSEELIKFRISVPKTLQYHKLLEHIKPYVTNMSMLPSENLKVSENKYLNSWIFIPSYNRSDRANVNLYHTMVTDKPDKSEPCQYTVVLVVRSTDFESYCKLWQSTHAVLQIPDTLPEVERDAFSGGIGFARLTIQIFAQHLKLEWIFMLDDNMPYVYEVEETDLVVKRENGTLVEKTVPLFKVLKHIERQVDGSVKEIPLDDFEKYTMKYANKHVMHPLEDYTGISEKYGIIGIKKYRPTIRRVRRPFSKTHVHSLLFLNITALSKMKIHYKPWQVFEDLTINNDCDDNGLWVCKYNRFTIWKRHMKTWIPEVYIWSEDVVLVKGLRDVQNSSDILIKYLKSECTIKKVIELPDEGAKEEKTEFDHFIQNISRENGKYVLFALRSHNFEISTEKLQGDISNQTYFTDGQNYFVILMSTAFCINKGMTTKSSVEKWLKEIIKQDFKFEIVTSHKIGEFSVKILLVIVRVNIPRRSTGAVPRKKRSTRPKNEKQEENPEKKVKVSEEESASSSRTPEDKIQLIDDVAALLQQLRQDPNQVEDKALLEFKKALTKGNHS